MWYIIYLFKSSNKIISEVMIVSYIFLFCLKISETADNDMY